MSDGIRKQRTPASTSSSVPITWLLRSKTKENLHLSLRDQFLSGPLRSADKRVLHTAMTLGLLLLLKSLFDRKMPGYSPRTGINNILSEDSSQALSELLLCGLDT